MDRRSFFAEVKWGYNGLTPGPVLELVEGDRVRIHVTNRLPEPTTVHWHGIVLPSGMDGVSGLSQRPIPPGETWTYEFTLRHPGTFMYHSHYDEMTQIALGAVGMIVVHPRRARGPRVDRDFVLMTHEWKVNGDTRRPDPNAMSDFNVLAFNGKAFPGTAPLLVGKGERVRIRLGNLGPMDHHPIHIHGLWFHVTATDGGYVPGERPAARDDGAGAGGSDEGGRVRSGGGRRLGDALPHDPPRHDADGHGLPNMVGMDPRTVERRMSRVVPEYMTMGHTGMGGMGEMRDGDSPQHAADAGRRRAVLLHRHGWDVHRAEGTGSGR
jgi:FtsP/CotA-like multicopper oxidase with cupredoxin domain